MNRSGDGVPKGMEESAAEEALDLTAKATPEPESPLPVKPVNPVKMLSWGRSPCPREEDRCLGRDRGGGSPARLVSTTPVLPAWARSGRERERASPPPKEAGTKRPPRNSEDTKEAGATEARTPEGTKLNAPE